MTVADKRVVALDQILELVVLLNQDTNQSLSRGGLTVSRARVLWELRQRGPMIQRDLAGALQVSARTVTGLVDALVATGFVTREPHPTDRRATLVTATEHGARTTEALSRGQQEFADLLFAGMPHHQFDCFVAGLGEILTRLRDRDLSHEIHEDHQ